MTEPSDGLVCAFIRDVDGRWREVSWPEVNGWTPDQGLLWVHLAADQQEARSYLRERSGIDEVAQDALLERETRPRTVAIGHHLVAILRGVNLNPGADPDDMVSIRLLAEGNRVISTRYRRVMAAEYVRDQIREGRGPESISALLVMFIGKLVDRMAGVIDGLDERVDELEDRMIEAESRMIRTDLAKIRREAIALRRYLAPQREALSRLYAEEFEWMDRRRRAQLREVTDRVIRYVEDLDSVRERAAVVQDELMNRLSDQMNRNMYLLTIVATVMLPLSFVTGLLGINVDGIPGMENAPLAFTIVCGILAVIAAIEIWIIRKLGWL